MSTFAGQGPDLTGWLKDAQFNTDRNLRLQYLAGFGLNTYENASIYDNMLAYRRYPDRLFVASPPSELLLREALAPPGAF